ncbi:MAG: hypothetical protein AAF408_07860 [Pseudomonadota bacterium]
MKRFAILALLIVAACETATTGTGSGSATGVSYPSDGFVTRNGIRAYPISATKFEVLPGNSGLFDDYWCGASEFARRRLGLPWSDRVYVASKIQQSVTTGRRSAVEFSVNPQADGITPVDLSFRSGFTIGDSMSITQANTRCRIYQPFFDR